MSLSPDDGVVVLPIVRKSAHAREGTNKKKTGSRWRSVWEVRIKVQLSPSRGVYCSAPTEYASFSGCSTVAAPRTAPAGEAR